MLIFFFILIFLAEVKLTIDIVCFIKRLDEKVCSLNDRITAVQPVIKSGFTSGRITLNKILLSLNNIHLKIKEKRNEYKIIIAKNLITGLLYLFLNTNGKKIISAIDLVISIKDFIKKII